MCSKWYERQDATKSERLKLKSRILLSHGKSSGTQCGGLCGVVALKFKLPAMCPTLSLSISYKDLLTTTHHVNNETILCIITCSSSTYLSDATAPARSLGVVEPKKKRYSGSSCMSQLFVIQDTIKLTNEGFRPEIFPSTFAEDLPKGSFEGRLADYPIATAGEKVSIVFDSSFAPAD